MTKIISIIEVGPGYNIVRYDNGHVCRREGARNWRNNNPGNIEYGSFTQSYGALGADPRFAIFPTYEDGRKCKEGLLFESASYVGLTLSKAIARYAPPVENDTNSYAKNIIAVVGKDQVMSKYTATERIKILDAMEKQEGFKIGIETFIRMDAVKIDPDIQKNLIEPLQELISDIQEDMKNPS